MEQSISERLRALAEPEFQKFTSRLLPGTEHILGVRLPKLRKIAREIARGGWRAYLAGAREDSFEEIMLQGMVIGYIQADLPERLRLVAAFIPKIDNWSVCDSFCSGLKLARAEPDTVWAFLQPYLHSEREFEARFGAVMLLFYYIDEAHISAVLILLDQLPAQGYYARMAVAWAISICFIRFPEQTMDYLKTGSTLDDLTYNRALQKIMESHCVDAETKSRVRRMKRKESAEN